MTTAKQNAMRKDAIRYQLAQKRHDGTPGGILAIAGVEWIQDGPRHTFASMHAATHGDMAKLASVMGNSVDILFKHYRAIYSEDEAADYWKLRPDQTTGKVIHMEGAAA